MRSSVDTCCSLSSFGMYICYQQLDFEFVIQVQLLILAVVWLFHMTGLALGVMVYWLEHSITEQEEPGSIPFVNYLLWEKTVGNYQKPADIKLSSVSTLRLIKTLAVLLGA